MVLAQGGVRVTQVLRALWTTMQRIWDHGRGFILFLQLLLLKVPSWVSQNFFSLATKSLNVRSFISHVDLKKQIPTWNKAPLCYQSSKKQPPNDRRIGQDCLHQITNWDAVRGSVATWTSLEETVMSPALHTTTVPDWKDLNTSCSSFSFHFHWEGGSGNMPFFQVQNCCTKGPNNPIWNTHRWNRELSWGVGFAPIHRCHCPSQLAPQEETEMHQLPVA